MKKRLLILSVIMRAVLGVFYSVAFFHESKVTNLAPREK